MILQLKKCLIMIRSIGISFQTFLAFLVVMNVSLNAHAKTILDMPGQDSRSNYHVTLNKSSALYEISVTQTTGQGQSETIYESSSLIKMSFSKNDEYRDNHARLIDNKNGTGTLYLNNGSNLKIELKE